MKTFILVILLSLNIFALEKLNLNDATLSKNTKVLLNSISEYAVKIGKGTLCETYVFVDPMCKHSQNYIRKLINNKKAQEISTYYIFLYKLPKFDSNKLSQYILQSPNKVDALQKVMLDKKAPGLNELIIDTNIQTRIKDIVNVATKLHIHIRPYIIEFEKGSRYCRVSSGFAPCLEENDF